MVHKVSARTSSLNLKGVVNEAKSYMHENHELLNDSKNFHIFYSMKSIKSLLENWGFVWSNSKLRPFVNGHERDDVVKYRKTFVDYFAENQNCYFIYKKVNKKDYEWNIKQEGFEKRIIIAHDESPFRSGDVQCYQ